MSARRMLQFAFFHAFCQLEEKTKKGAAMMMQ